MSFILSLFCPFVCMHHTTLHSRYDVPRSLSGDVCACRFQLRTFNFRLSDRDEKRRRSPENLRTVQRTSRLSAYTAIESKVYHNMWFWVRSAGAKTTSVVCATAYFNYAPANAHFSPSSCMYGVAWSSFKRNRSACLLLDFKGTSIVLSGCC